MNERKHTSSAASTVTTGKARKNVSRTILFAILAVMIVALIYEYGFVLRSYRAAESAIDDMVDTATDSRGEEPITPEQVRERFRKQPTRGLQDKEHYYVEHYQWRRWLPWNTLDIYVVYEHSDPPNLFHTTRPEPPGPSEIPFGL
jgi:hypothetical protein